MFKELIRSPVGPGAQSTVFRAFLTSVTGTRLPHITIYQRDQCCAHLIRKLISKCMLLLHNKLFHIYSINHAEGETGREICVYSTTK